MQESEKNRVLGDSERQEVIDALEAILTTEKFEAAPQMSAFLRYVVEQAADGNQSRIKAFTVAVDALGKPDSFDPQNDPVVRVLAGRLRAALSSYNDEHPNALVMITMTPGSYVPSFERQAAETNADQTLDSESAQAAHQPVSARGSDELVEAISETDRVIDEREPSVTTGTTDQNVLENASDETIASATAPKREASAADPSSSVFGFLGQTIGKVPRLAVAAVLLLAVGFGFLQDRTDRNEPGVLAATPTGEYEGNLSSRNRPAEPTVFISAIDYGNSLENSLNTVVSGVVSEIEHVKVYRILDSEIDIRYWPEDYILTLTTSDLPEETRIDMQLVEARTGRIVHTEAVGLNEQATNQLTLDELGALTETARSIVAAKGPLISDFASRLGTK